MLTKEYMRATREKLPEEFSVYKYAPEHVTYRIR